jgi:hypothetical protein
MKKAFSRATLMLISVFLCSAINAPNASAWSSDDITMSTFGGTYREEPRSIKIDGNGNIYSSGYFRGTVDFDPGEGVVSLTSPLASIFLLKLDSSGNFLWVKSFGGSIGGNSGNTIAFDGAGHLYLGGNFAGRTDFDPGDGTAFITPATGEDAFIVKLDLNGNYIWARSFGGLGGNANADGIGTIEVDGSGNVIANGLFTGEVDFDPGIGESKLLSISGNSSDFFILKLNSSGNFVWAKSIDTSGPPYGGTLSLDSDGNVYAAGIFYGAADFDPGTGVETRTAAKSMDTFIVSLDPAGNYRWANTYGVNADNANEDWIFSLANDRAGNLYATGYFSGTVDFDLGTGVANLSASGNSNDIFILKLNSSGAHLWSKKYGNTGSDGAWSITTDTSGNVYTTGGFTGEVNFNTNASPETLTSGSNSLDTYILKLDPSGNFLWAKRAGGSGSDNGIAISLDRVGNVYTAGIFTNTVDFNPGADTSNVQSNGDIDIFILKLNSTGEVDVAEARAAAAAVREAAARAAAEAAARAAEAAAKAASEVAEAQREAEKQSARANVAAAIKDAKELTVDSFAKAQIPGINASNIGAVQAELMELPEEARSDINQVLKVARKYEVVGIIASDQVKSIPTKAFVEVGLIPESSKNKFALAAAVKKLPAEARGSLADIKKAIEAASAAIQKRADRLAKVLTRNSSGSSK